jgi:hypothetical protein
MTINIDGRMYNELLEWLYTVGKPYAQKGDFELWTIPGGIQLMKQRFTKEDGFVSVCSFKLPPPKPTDKVEYTDFYQEWARWAHSVDATKEPLIQPPIKFEHQDN